MRPRSCLALILAAYIVAGSPGAGGAQDLGVVESPLLVLDTERLFTESEPGNLFLQQYKDARDALIAKNREVEKELRDQEQALTEKRNTLSAQDFRAEADAFDEKVRHIREDSERASRDLERSREQAPFVLMRQAEGVLFEIMREAGGVIILDARQVLVRSDAIDITDLAIMRVNQAMVSQQDQGATPDPQEPPTDEAEPQVPDGTGQEAPE